MAETTPLLGHPYSPSAPFPSSLPPTQPASFYRYADEQSDDIDKDLICPICQGPFTNPTRSVSCGHTFCKFCINRWAEINRTCPLDHSALGQMQSDRLANNLVSKLTVICLLCSIWRGSKTQFSSHLKEAHNQTFNEDSGMEGYSLAAAPPSYSQPQHHHHHGHSVPILEGFVCVNHPTSPSIAVCTACGRFICGNCVRTASSYAGTRIVCVTCAQSLANRRTIGFMISMVCFLMSFGLTYWLIATDDNQ